MAGVLSAIGTAVRRAVGMGEEEPEIPTGERGPAPYPLTDDAEPHKYATYSKQLLAEQSEVMEPLFLTWTQNILFLAGLQWWKYDPMMGTFSPPIPSSWKERPVRNLLLPFFKTFMGKVTKNRPAGTCIPGNTSPEATEAAALGDEILEAKWHELKMGDMLRRSIAWAFPTGNAFIMPYWNRDAGVLIPLTAEVEVGIPDPLTGVVTPELVECPCDENGEPYMDAFGQPDLSQPPAIVDIGDPGFRVLSPFQVYPDVSAENDEDAHHFLVAEPMPHRDIYRKWPHITKLVAEDTSKVDRFSHMISVFASGADTHIAASQTKRSSHIPKAIVLHYYERPCQEWPEGRHWATVGDQLLEKPGPLPDGIWPPMRRLKDVEVAGRYHAEATMTAAVGLNREYNEVCAQIKEHHNLMARGKWLVPKGSGIRRGQITNQPGEVLQHTPGLEPKMATIAPLPNAVYQERDRILADIQLIMGMHQSSMGEAPPGVTSGRAFLTLQEADDTDLGPFITMLEQLVADLSWDELRLIQRNYTEERLLRVSGKDNSFRVRAFKGEDLRDVVGVKPQAGSAIPWSSSARQSLLVELGQNFPALFTDPDSGMFDTERFRRLLPLGGTEAIDLSSDLDFAEARREEEYFKMFTGMPVMDPDSGMMLPAEPLPTPQPWQNHLLHMRQHGRTLKGAQFYEWPEAAQHMFVAHWLHHQQMLTDQLAHQAALAGAVQGTDQNADGQSDKLGVGTARGPEGGGGGQGSPASITTPDSAPAALEATRRDVESTREAVASA